jgi:hypothetical protein
VRPRVALNTARRVAASPRLVRRLARPLVRGRAIVRQAVATGRVPARAVGGMRAPMGGMMRPRGGMMGPMRRRGGHRRRSFVIRGPVRITRLGA